MNSKTKSRLNTPVRHRVGALWMILLLASLAAAQGGLIGAPTCVIQSPAPSTSVMGDVTVTFVVDDPDLDAVDLWFDFSTDSGVTWSPATAAAASPLANPTVGVATPAGPLDFIWATTIDLPAPVSVILRISLQDATRLPGECTVAFLASPLGTPGTPVAPTCAIIDPAPGTSVSGDVAISFDVDDLNFDPVEVSFFFSGDLGVTYLPATAAAGSPLTNPASGLTTPLTRALFLWDSVADGAIGQTEFRIVARDAGGLSGSCDTSMSVCQIQPTIQPLIGLISPPPAGGAYCRDIFLSVGASGGGCGGPDSVEITLSYVAGAAGCASIPPIGSLPLSLYSGQPVVVTAPFGAPLLVVWDSPQEIPGMCSGEIHAEITAIHSSCGSCMFIAGPPSVIAIDVDNRGGAPSVLCTTICGDANLNGQVNAIDALLIAFFALGCPPGLPCPTAQSECLDLNASGTVDLIDALLAAQYSVGMTCGVSCP